MSSGVGQLVLSGPLLAALPVAVAAGAITFLSPCVLPLVPGYLAYLTGMSGSADPAADSPPGRAGIETVGIKTVGTDAAGIDTGGTYTADRAERAAASGAPAAVAAKPPRQASPFRPKAGRRRAVAGTFLFVLGFSVLFVSYGTLLGGIGVVLRVHQRGLSQLLGALVIVLGLMFAGVFDRFALAGRIVRPSVRPRAGLAGAPLLGVLFGLGWTPCTGPTLTAVLTLSYSSSNALRGAVLAFGYSLGIGIPFLAVAIAAGRGMRLLGFARRNARLIGRIGGALLVTVGVLEVTGAWATAVIWLQVHWLPGYSLPL